ncbi:MAG TPA: methyltransferase domain-containing protein [Actinomycetota bacterium]|jgi:SAM-dependent methyltransferase
MATAADRWAEQLAAWAIPDGILAQAPESPWGFPVEPFRRRAERSADEAPTSVSARLAREALPDGGSVLDVGSGAGAASLALSSKAGTLTAFDPSERMLAAFDELAAAAGVQHRAVRGSWPEDAGLAEPADVVVCHHVVYNSPDLPGFARALGSQARRRVVIEMTANHPRAWMNDMWMRFWSLERPDGPTSDDAEVVLRDLGIDVRREDWKLQRQGVGPGDEAVASARRMLCLTPDRDPEVAEALGDRLWSDADGRWFIGQREQPVTTLWWDV